MPWNKFYKTCLPTNELPYRSFLADYNDKDLLLSMTCRPAPTQAWVITNCMVIIANLLSFTKPHKYALYTCTVSKDWKQKDFFLENQIFSIPIIGFNKFFCWFVQVWLTALLILLNLLHIRMLVKLLFSIGDPLALIWKVLVFLALNRHNIMYKLQVNWCYRAARSFTPISLPWTNSFCLTLGTC